MQHDRGKDTEHGAEDDADCPEASVSQHGPGRPKHAVFGNVDHLFGVVVDVLLSVAHFANFLRPITHENINRWEQCQGRGGAEHEVGVAPVDRLDHGVHQWWHHDACNRRSHDRKSNGATAPVIKPIHDRAVPNLSAHGRHAQTHANADHKIKLHKVGNVGQQHIGGRHNGHAIKHNLSG